MYCSVCSFEPEIGTSETASRETIPEAENEFSSESLICRTMTRGLFPAEAATTENFTLEDSFHKTRNYRHNHIKVSSQSSHTSKMNRSILKTISLIKNRRFSNFLSSAPSVMRSSGSESCPHLSLSSSVSSSASSARPIKSHHQSHWSFGMILIAAIILSTFSTSTVVTCVPLGHEVGGGGGGSIATRLMTSNSKLGEIVDVDDSVAKGQKFVPLSSSSSILTTPGGQSLERGRRAASSSAAEDNKSNRRLLTNYHLERFHHHQQKPEEINPFLRSAPIQKLLNQHKDFSSLSGDDEDDSEEAVADVGRGHGARFGVEGESKTTGANDETDNENDNSGQSEWETVIDPHLYVLTEWNSQPYQEQFPILQQQQRKRRNSGTGPSLSIVNPLDVLRQRLLLEIARRRMRQSHNQIIANEEILRKIGRRRR